MYSLYRYEGKFTELSIDAANALASEDVNGEIRDRLITAVNMVVRGPYAEDWTRRIIIALEDSQPYGGLHKDKLWWCARSYERKAREADNNLTKPQLNRVWLILQLACPTRGLCPKGTERLGVPYKIMGCGDGAVAEQYGKLLRFYYNIPAKDGKPGRNSEDDI